MNSELSRIEIEGDIQNLLCELDMAIMFKSKYEAGEVLDLLANKINQLTRLEK